MSNQIQQLIETNRRILAAIENSGGGNNTLLQEISNKLDDLSIDADTINLNTDHVELGIEDIIQNQEDIIQNQIDSITLLTSIHNDRDYKSNRKYYNAGVLGIVPAASTGDIFQIRSASSKNAYITKIGVSGQATTAVGVRLSVVKRSTINSGGTPVSVTAVPLNSGSDAAGVAISYYTANPTPGTTVGILRTLRLTLATATGLMPDQIIDFGEDARAVCLLAGGNEALAISFNSTSISGGAVNIWVEWYEEN